MSVNHQSICFVYSWGQGPREKCWSGTPYGIEEALKKKTNVRDIALAPETRIQRIIRKIRWKLLYNNGDDFNITATKRGIRELNSRGKRNELGDNDPILVFKEYCNNKVANTYSFQDLTVDFLIRFESEYPDLLQFTPLSSNLKRFAIQKRIRLTQQFNSRCRGLFTMSRWLANDLVERTGIAKERVHWVGGGATLMFPKLNES